MRRWKSAGNLRDPGIWTELSNMYPTPRGSYRTAPIFTTLGTAGAGPSTPGTTLAAVALHDVSGTVITYVGTSTKLYSATAANFQAGSFTDRSVGGGYTASQWCFAQFGNITIATNLTDAVQSRDATGSGAFAALGGSPPKAKIVVTQSNCVLLFNINDGASKPNSWAASDVGNHTNWSTGDAVTATPILHRPGEITGAIAFRDYVLVFKRNSIYMMRYVGSPIYWTVELLDDVRGVTSLGSICNCGDFIVFSGMHGTTIFDGSGFRDISDGFQLEVGLSNLAFNVGTDTSIYFPAEQSVVFFTGGNQAWVYNLKTDQWGYFYIYRDGTTAQTGFKMLFGTPAARADAIGGIQGDIANSGLCLVNMGATGTGTDDVCLKSTDSWTPDASITAYVTSSFVGNEATKTMFKRVTPICGASSQTSWPSAGGLTITPYIGDTPTVSIAAGSAITSSTSTNRGDLSVVGRFGRFKISVTGAGAELEDVAIDAVPAGAE